MSEHPTPWIKDDEIMTSDDGECIDVLDANGDLVANTYANQPITADLIAAAPDLLAAVDLLLKCDPFTGGNEDARAAYLKATGKEWES